MRKITKEEYEDVFNPGEYTEVTDKILRWVCVLDEVVCSECGSNVFVRQGDGRWDATVGCMNPDCDNKAVLR